MGTHAGASGSTPRCPGAALGDVPVLTGGGGSVVFHVLRVLSGSFPSKRTLKAKARLE